MQDNNLMQPAMQPFIKLVQSNMELLNKYALSPEAISQAMTNAQNVLQHGPGAAATMAQPNVFAELMQGMLKNYTEFMTELSQSAMAMLAQGQAAMMQKVQEASDNVVDATEGRGRRPRQAA